MDVNSVTSVLRPACREELGAWQPGDAVLAGGTWLFSEPQPGITRLVDLDRLGWEPLQADGGGLTIAATCTIARLAALEAPASWRAAPLIGMCCNALLGSFKIWNMATVGGNICLALPAGPMTALATALEAVATVWRPDGTERRASVPELVVGPQRCSLAPGEVLRAIRLPASALSRRHAFRRASLTPHGRSAALLIGTIAEEGLVLTITASTPCPVRLAFAGLPDAAALRTRIERAVPQECYYADVHGRPDWRRHMTLDLAEELRWELASCG